MECEHLTQELRYRITDAGRRRYVYQCIDCGEPVKRVPHSEAIGTEAPFNERLLKMRQDKQQDEWFIKYNEYLSSPQWRARRRLVLARDNYTCQACLLAPADEVHHLTYAHVFNEPLFDLISICRRCHETVTELDRSRRR